MNREQRRRLKGDNTAVSITTPLSKHKIRYILGSISLIVLGVIFAILVGFYANFYHNELGKVKLECEDKSVLYVQEDGTFKWFRSKDELEKEYLTGILRYYTGADAYKELDKHSSDFWNITSDTIDTMFDDTYKKEDFFIMIVEGVYYVEDDLDHAQDNSDYVKYYLGFHIDNTLHTLEQATNGIRQFYVKEYDL